MFALGDHPNPANSDHLISGDRRGSANPLVDPRPTRECGFHSDTLFGKRKLWSRQDGPVLVRILLLGLASVRVARDPPNVTDANLVEVR